MKKRETDNYFDQYRAQKRQKRMIRNQKTDKPKYEKSKIERLLLYSIGKSRIPLSPSQIEHEIKNKEPFGSRPTYVYEVVENLSPTSDSFPHTFLLKYSDIIDVNGKIKQYPSNEEKDKSRDKIINNIFQSYKNHFGWEDSSDLKYIGEKVDRGSLWLKIQVDKGKRRYIIKIEFTLGNTVLEKDGVNLFYNEMNVPLVVKKKKGTKYIYSTRYTPNLDSEQYLDKIPKLCNISWMPNNIQDKSNIIATFYDKDEIWGYVLNLKGFLRYLVLNSDWKINYDDINEVIENLSNIDNYWNIISQIRNQVEDAPKNIEFTELFEMKRFPFLSFYNTYKDKLPTNLAVNILLDIAEDLSNEFETMDITEIKYKVTERFFSHIENYFWESRWMTESRITDRYSISDETFSTLRKYQSEIRNYLEYRKLNELASFGEQTRFYNKYNIHNEIRRQILKYIQDNIKPVISLKEIPFSDYPKSTPIDHDGSKVTMIKEICHSYLSERYLTSSGFFLFSCNIIEKINKYLKSGMTYEKAKEIISTYGITNERAIKDVITLSGFLAKSVDRGQSRIIKRTN